MVDPAERRVHRAPEGGPDPERADRCGHSERRRAVADVVERAVQRVRLDGREQALEVVQDAGLDVGALEDPAEDEEDEQRERK